MRTGVWRRVGTWAVVAAVVMTAQRASAQVPDEVWHTLQDREVLVGKQDGTSLAGTLIAVDTASIVLVQANGYSVEVDRSDVKFVQERSPSGAGDTTPLAGVVKPANDPQPTVASSSVVEPANDAEAAVIPSPWSGWCGLGVGPAWGEGVPKRGIRGPYLRLHLDLAIAYHFGYVGIGGVVTTFEETHPSTVTVVPVEGIGSSERRESSASAVGGYLEAGVVHGLFIRANPTEAFEVRPGVGYGLEAISSVRVGFDDCVDCGGKSIDYNAGHYVRLQLGIYYSRHHSGGALNGFLVRRKGWFLGLTPSYQYFFFGSSPRLTHSLTFSFTAGLL